MTSNKDSCPRVGCGLPFSTKTLIGRTFEESMIDSRDAKACFIPILMDGDPGVARIGHSYQDLIDGGWKPEEVDDDDPSEPGDLSEDHAIIYGIVEAASRGEMCGENHSALQVQIKHAAIEHGVEKGRVKPVLLNLMYHGFIEEVTNAVFQVPEVVPA